MELTNRLVDIADSIRAKTGKTEKFTLAQMSTEIDSIISSPDGSDVSFGGSDSMQSGQYAISAEIMNAIVAEIQKMSGRTNPLTPEEMLYWLRRVVYIPQGYAESVNSIVSNVSSASGRLPTVVRGRAVSTQYINNTSYAVGSLVESA